MSAPACNSSPRANIEQQRIITKRSRHTAPFFILCLWGIPPHPLARVLHPRAPRGGIIPPHPHTFIIISAPKAAGKAAAFGAILYKIRGAGMSSPPGSRGSAPAHSSSVEDLFFIFSAARAAMARILSFSILNLSVLGSSFSSSRGASSSTFCSPSLVTSVP